MILLSKTILLSKWYCYLITDYYRSMRGSMGTPAITELYQQKLYISFDSDSTRHIFESYRESEKTVNINWHLIQPEFLSKKIISITKVDPLHIDIINSTNKSLSQTKSFFTNCKKWDPSHIILPFQSMSTFNNKSLKPHPLLFEKSSKSEPKNRMLAFI